MVSFLQGLCNNFFIIMKNEFKKVALLGLFATSIFGFAQNTQNTNLNKNSAVLSKKDKFAEEQQKKLALAEKNKMPKPYDAKADAEKDILNSIAKAKSEGKNVIIQAGGNWCIWCLRFNQYVQTTPELKKMVDDNFIYYHLNYSPDNKNEKVFAKYGNPGDKFGYPVFIVLNSDGEMIHVQESSVLEEGKGYSLEKTKTFFTNWIPKK